MGIFTKRDIQKHEELTFNYNVDRYGCVLPLLYPACWTLLVNAHLKKFRYSHQAQICYCGEPNCVGYIGGKTQTDIAAMDDLYLDGNIYRIFVVCVLMSCLALGITDEADLMELKGSKKKKGKKIDDPDFMVCRVVMLYFEAC
jgi:[histone H3]-lysine36 N-trimethyltransferase